MAKPNTKQTEAEASLSEKSLYGEKHRKITTRIELKNSVGLNQIITLFFSKLGGVSRPLATRISREIMKEIKYVLVEKCQDLDIPLIGTIRSTPMDSNPIEFKCNLSSSQRPPGSVKIELEQKADIKKRSKHTVMRKTGPNSYSVLPWYSHLYDNDGVPREDSEDDDWLNTAKVDMKKREHVMMERESRMANTKIEFNDKLRKYDENE
jgi:hypothetical protein